MPDTVIETGTIGIGSRVRVNITSPDHARGLTPSRRNGLEGRVVKIGWGGHDDDFVLRLDDQTSGAGWKGGDPDDPEARCLHLPAEALELIEPEPGVGSRVRFQVPAGERIRGLEHDDIDGKTGTVVATEHPRGVFGHGSDWVIALDDQGLGLGWGGDDYGRPDEMCVHFPRENLVIIGHMSTASDPEPDPPEFNTWRQELYAKAIDLGRTSYPSYMRHIERWLKEVGVAPKSVTYRISGELKYETGSYRDSVPSLSGLSRERLENLPDVKLEIADVTYARRRPGQTIESTTADIFALVDRVVARGDVCDEAKVFIRRLGLRPPPRHEHAVTLKLNLNAAELAQLQRANSVDAFHELIRSRRTDTREPFISSIEVAVSDATPEPAPAKPRKSRSRAKATTEPEATPEPTPAPELVAAT